MKPALGHPSHDDDLVQVQGELAVQVGGEPELLLGEEPGLDTAGEIDLLGRREQRNPPDLPQILAEQVGRGAPGVGRAASGRFDGFGGLGLGLHFHLCPGSLGRARLLGLGVVRGAALRGDPRDDVGIRVRVDGVVGLGEGLGLHGGDLQECRC